MGLTCGLQAICKDNCVDEKISLWMQLAKNSNVIFDIGANTGLYGLVAKSINSSSKIYSFEPLPGVYRFLDKNIQENSFDINSYELGLSNYDGKAKVYSPSIQFLSLLCCSTDVG